MKKKNKHNLAHLVPQQVTDRLTQLQEENKVFEKIIAAQVGTSVPEFFNQLETIILNPSNISVGVLGRMIDTDDTISSSVEFKSLMVLSKIGDYHHEDKKIRDFVNDFIKKLERPTWEETLEGILTGQAYGYSVSEIVWKLDKSLNKVPARIPTYHPATICFEVDANGLITDNGIIQFTSQFSVASNPNNALPLVKYGWKVNNPFETPTDRMMPLRIPFMTNFYMVRIPRNKVIHFVYRPGQAFGSPYGKTAVRTSHLLWQLKNFLLKQMGVGAKRKSSPLLWGTAPVGSSKVSIIGRDGTEKQLNPTEALREILSQIESDDSVVTGPEGQGWKLQAIMNQINMNDYIEVINAINTWIFRCFLLPSLVMTDGSAGSRALGDKHFQIVDKIASTEAKNLTNTIIRDLIRPAILDNFGPQDDYGKFNDRPQSIEERERLSNIFIGLGNAGWMSPANKEDRSHVRSSLSLNEDTDKTFDLFKEDDDSFKGDATPKKKDEGNEEVPASTDDDTKPDPDNALNGAQVTAIVSIISQITAGTLPRQSGIEIIISSYGKSREEVERMVGEAGKGNTPKEDEDDPEDKAKKTEAE